jgi:hypothetical protein
MKHYTLPIFLMLAASALMLFGIAKSFEVAGRSARELAAQRSAVESARQQLIAVQQRAETAKKKSAPVDEFLAAWTPEISNESSIEQIFGRLDTLAVDNLLSPSGKNFNQNTNYFFDGRHLTIQSVNITVSGDYYRTLNWLGTVENAFPLARVEQISYTTNANSLALAVQFVFPRKFDSE